MKTFQEFMNEEIKYKITLEPSDTTKYSFTPELFTQYASSFKQACFLIQKKNPDIKKLIDADKAKFVWKNPHSATLMSKYIDDILSRGYSKED
jgi:hypothetical protein